MALEKNSNGWHSVLDTRGVNRFQGRGKLVEIPSQLHAEPPGVPMERTTFYSKNYPGHEINESDVQKPIKRKDMIGLSEKKLDGQSMYAKDYPKYPGATPAQLRPNKTNLHFLTGKVGSDTSYTREFVEYEDACSNRTELIRRRDNLHPSSAKFEKNSVTATDFQ